jgi:nitrate reductase delta subunit
MTIAYKALAALLAYPTRELIDALPEIDGVIEREPGLARRDRTALRALIDSLAASDLLDAQERYVALFDGGRATSLHLFEHVHGESRDRGQAMVDLNAMYARASLALTANELPDYLPVLLEFVSLQPDPVARDVIDECAHVVRKIGEALVQRESPYAAVLSAVLTLAGRPGLDLKSVRETEPERSLDEEWVEEPVIFGPAAGAGCGTKPSTSVIKFVPRAATTQGASR